MVCFEQLSYYLGKVTADLVLFSILPSSSFVAYKVVFKFSDFATSHKLPNKNVETISENLFKCLPYLD